MSDKVSNKLTVRSFKVSDFDKILKLEKSFGKDCWEEMEAFLGPTRFVSVLDKGGDVVAYQVTYTTPSGEPRSKVLMTKGFEDRKVFEFLMAPTFIKHGANMRIDKIKVKEDDDDDRKKRSKKDD